MLSLLATILSWEDSERERAGLQRAGGSTTPGGRKASSARRKESEAQAGPGQGRTQEEQDKYNEVRALQGPIHGTANKFPDSRSPTCLSSSS